MRKLKTHTLLYLALIFSLFLHTNTTFAATDLGFMNGVDISALTALENDGAVYRDTDGTPGDPIQILSNHGINSYRLRLFVNPTGNNGLDINNLDYTINLAKRIKAAGGNLLLDLHYSDTWADPGHQTKPAAWQNLNDQQLITQVQNYSNHVIDTMKSQGVLPDAVQIGNEISNGILWPNGQLWQDNSNRELEFDRLASLLNAGIQGVKEAAGNSTPKIMLHLAKADNWWVTETIFSELEARNVDYDMMGFSFYPRYSGTIASVTENLTNAVNKFNKPAVLAEIGFSYIDSPWEPNQENYEHEMSIEGQRQFTADVMNMMEQLPNNMGQGVYWWHAAATPTNHELAWNNGRLGLFDQNGVILPAATELGRQIPVPEPTSVGLLVGIATLAASRRRFI
ncbi:glycosyl hydrolase 53 family protein [Planctomycetota bacterium]|nr:glycosyl hydrolase 53 family protein [Planctomycetota bacterium]